MARAVVDMNTLDQLVRDELDKLEGGKDFGVAALWRQDPDETGANWDAVVRQFPGNASGRQRPDVVARLRASFSLDDEGG
jgi:hypothetical protein